MGRVEWLCGVRNISPGNIYETTTQNHRRLILLYLIEGWRGARALSEVKQRLASEGESIELPANAHEPVPQEDNFFGIPQLAPLFEFTMNGPRENVTYRDEEAVERFSAMVPPSSLVPRVMDDSVPGNVEL